MNVDQVNYLLLQDNLELREVFPKLLKFQTSTLQFHCDFGLERLPEEPGIILIRGARQFGKSTWLERQIEKTYSEYGPGSALYLNGDKWERGIKLLSDRGRLADILVVTTGSSASDIRRGAERLPGRKGRLSRTHYIFTPCSYREFRRVAANTFGDDTLREKVLS